MFEREARESYCLKIVSLIFLSREYHSNYKNVPHLYDQKITSTLKYAHPSITNTELALRARTQVLRLSRRGKVSCVEHKVVKRSSHQKYCYVITSVRIELTVVLLQRSKKRGSAVDFSFNHLLIILVIFIKK